MKIVEFKRATNAGLENASGELLEWEGFQFCLTIVGNSSMAIELSSGAVAYDAYRVEQPKKLRIKTIAAINGIGVQSLKEAIEKFKKEHTKFTYPVNEPVK